jgi:hypothetical protein
MRAQGLEVTPSLKWRLKDALRGAAMLGACEERTRTLEFLREEGLKVTSANAQRFIVSRGVLEVLGYDNEQGGKEI